MPDTTVLGELVCLDPPGSCTDAEIAFGDEEACTTGDLLDGTPFEGCDAVRLAFHRGRDAEKTAQ